MFVAVAEAGGFTRAASTLNSSPSAITRTIAALEHRLGVRLLNRTTRAVHLTEPGTRFLDDARRLLADLDAVEQGLSGEARQPAGEITITAPVMAGRALLGPIIKEFSAAYPPVRIAMLLFDRVVDLVDEGVDLAIRIAHLPDSSLVATRLGTVRRLLVASPAYLERRGTPETPGALADHVIIAHTTLLAGREWRHVDNGKPNRIALRPSVETNDTAVNIDLAEQGLGITIVLSYMVADALRTGRLVPVLENHAPPAVPVHLVQAQSRMIAPKIRAFVSFAVPRLRAALAEAARGGAAHTGVAQTGAAHPGAESGPRPDSGSPDR